jgi:UDP-sugar transporter A1/2/3
MLTYSAALLVLLATYAHCLPTARSRKLSRLQLGIQSTRVEPPSSDGLSVPLNSEELEVDGFANKEPIGKAAEITLIEVEDAKLVPEVVPDLINEVRDSLPRTSSFWSRKTVEQGVALSLLLLQNTGMIILMRLSRLKAGGGGVMYDIRSAVFLNELMKLCFSSYMYVTTEKGSIQDIKAKSPPLHLFKVIVPSALYVLQNNLQYVAVSNLPASVYQVLIQMKIITTALMSEVLMNRRHNKAQWASLFSLFAGLAMVQSSLAGAAASSFVGNLSLGIIAVVVSCVTSAGAGVYFERVVKGTPNVGLWAFNVQMSACAFLISCFTCLRLANPLSPGVGFGPSIFANVPTFSTLFQGFTPLVLSIVALQAFGGLMTALVVKRTNSVVKGFATSGAVVLSCVVSRFLFTDFHMSPLFYVGATIVSGAAFAFGRASPGLKKRAETQ